MDFLPSQRIRAGILSPRKMQVPWRGRRKNGEGQAAQVRAAAAAGLGAQTKRKTAERLPEPLRRAGDRADMEEPPACLPQSLTKKQQFAALLLGILILVKAYTPMLNYTGGEVVLLFSVERKMRFLLKRRCS